MAAVSAIRSTIETLATAVVEEDFAPIDQLFLAAKTRPPLIAWRPTPALLRSPVLERLLTKWSARRLTPSLPPQPATAPLLFEGPDSEWTMLIEKLPGDPTADPRRRMVYRHYGAGIARHCGRDLSGSTLATFSSHLGIFFAAVYEAVRRRPEPIFTEHEPQSPVLVRSWRRLILPFALPDRPVDTFVIGNIPESAVGTLLDVMYDPAIVADGKGRILLVNRAALEFFETSGRSGAADAAMVGDHLPGLVPLMQRLAHTIDGSGALGRHELELVQNGRRLILDVSIGGTRVAGEPLFVLVLRDLTERAEREHSLRHIAFRDELTGVLNRHGFNNTALARLVRQRRAQDGYGVLVLDIDDFKLLNDTHGHVAGDRVLRAVAQRISASLRREDAVARWGGDEFVILLDGIVWPLDLETAARKLLDALSAPYDLPSGRIRVSVSIGGALHPEHGDTFETVLAAADQALYRAKSAIGNRLYLAPEPYVGSVTAP